MICTLLIFPFRLQLLYKYFWSPSFLFWVILNITFFQPYKRNAYFSSYVHDHSSTQISSSLFGRFDLTLVHVSFIPFLYLFKFIDFGK